MKKALLLAGLATLMSASSAWADIRYVQVGEPLSGTASEVTAKMKAHQENGGLYFLQMHTKNSKKSGFAYASNKNLRDNYKWDYDGVYEIDEAGEVNNNKVFQVDFVEGTDNFSIKNLFSGHYFSIQGNNNYGKHRVIGTADGTDTYTGGQHATQAYPCTIANYTVVDYPEAGDLHDDDPLKDIRYSLKVTNATLDNNGTSPIYLQGYGNDDDANKAVSAYLAYQSYASGTSTAQVVFIPVKSVETTTITVKFPDCNGMTMTEEIYSVAG